MQNKVSILFMLNLYFLSLNSQDIVIGDNLNEGKSFSFNIKAHNIFIPGQKFFIGSKQEIADNIFAICSNLYGSSGFKPLANKKVILNNVENSDNPICGAAINNIAMAGYFPVVSKKNDSKIYAINDAIASSLEVIASDDILDFNGQKVANILSLTTDLPRQLEAPETLYSDRNVFAAVRSTSGSFELAYLQLKVIKEAKDKRDNIFFEFFNFDANNGISGNRSVPINLDSGSQIEKISDIYFDDVLNRLYIALKVRSGDKGTKALLVAGLYANKLIVQSIAPDSALLNSCKIISTDKPNCQLSIDKVRTMFTRTYLNYLIVVKDKKEVYAMPLVNNTGSEFHGCLADVNSENINVFTKGLPHRFLTRTFLNSAKTDKDLYDQQDLRAKVGCHNLDSKITDIEVSGDTVFVSVKDDSDIKSGIFQSQALFDDSGKIIGWTKWKRAALEPENIKGFSFNPITADFWSISDNNVLKTSWTHGQTDIEKLISREFLKELSGVFSLTEFDYNSKGLNKDTGDRLAFMVLTGFNKVGLIQTACDVNNIFTERLSNISEENFVSFKDGAIADLKDYNNLSGIFISGADLNKIGTINSSIIVSDDKYAWLLVSGSNGIAILCKEDGSGWPLNPGLSKGFKELSNMSFKYIEDYKSVVKIYATENRLYILTEKELNRINLDLETIANIIQKKDYTVSNLAQVSTNNLSDVEIFSDFLIEEPIALLATSNGFFRSGDSIDISLITNDLASNWTLIDMPEPVGTIFGNGPATRIFSTPSFIKGKNKYRNIYLLNAYSGYEQAQIYRYALSLENNKVSRNSVLLFQDIFIKDKPTFFVNLEDYRNYIYFDGAVSSASRSSFMSESPKIFLLPYNLKSSQRFGARNLISLNLGLDNYKTIGQLSKSVSGAFIVYGDFGIRLNK